MDKRNILFTDVSGFVSFHAKVFFTYLHNIKYNVLTYDLKNKKNGTSHPCVATTRLHPVKH